MKSSNDSSLKLHVFLAKLGLSSRRGAERFIQEGRVLVNGKKVIQLGLRIDPDHDQITVDGKVIPKKSQKLRYFLFHKPLGVMTTLKDPHAQKTVHDFFKDLPERVVPAGRLDQNSTGLLLMTNDGDLIYQMTHPSFEIEKSYRVTLNKPMLENQRTQLERGVIIEGKKTAPCKIKKLSPQNTWQFLLKEGRKREIRRMAQTVGLHVASLHRERFGPLELGPLKTGERRELTPREVHALLNWIRTKAVK